MLPGEAHWKLGTCEQAIRGIKDVMDKIVAQEPTVDAPEALAEAVRVFNNKEIIRGFSPVQHLLGKAPDETGRCIQSMTELPYESLLENPDGEQQRNLKRMLEAEK